MITTYYHPHEIKYNGSQLHSRWVEDTFKIKGDVIAAFFGPCDVLNEFMVDTEDLNAGASIYSESMLHFIVEHFEVDMAKIVLRQRLLTAILMEELNRKIKDKPIVRDGDDLFDGKHKVTISIATTSPTSSLIHFGINICSDNTPVLTKGLKDYDICSEGFAHRILAAYKKEEESMSFACGKVKLVK